MEEKWEVLMPIALVTHFLEFPDCLFVKSFVDEVNFRRIETSQSQQLLLPFWPNFQENTKLQIQFHRKNSLRFCV